MRTFKAYFKKEIIESWRQYRYLVLAVGFIFFAIADPLMLKILPTILKNQIPAEMMQFMQFDPVQAVANYMKDIYQLGNLFVILSLMGIISDEIGQEKLVFPYSKGSKSEGFVLAKSIHYSLTLLFLILVGFILNTYYVNLLFEGVIIGYADTLRSGLLFAIYYIFTISLLLLFSSFTRKGLVAGMIVLLFNYIEPVLYNIKGLADWLPYNLVRQANMLGDLNMSIAWKSILITLLYAIILQVLTIWRMKRVEVI